MSTCGATGPGCGRPGARGIYDENFQPDGPEQSLSSPADRRHHADKAPTRPGGCFVYSPFFHSGSLRIESVIIFRTTRFRPAICASVYINDEGSDVDVLVEVDPSIGLRLVQLADELERALGRHVDVVSRRAIKAAMWERIEPELIDA